MVNNRSYEFDTGSYLNSESLAGFWDFSSRARGSKLRGYSGVATKPSTSSFKQLRNKVRKTRSVHPAALIGSFEGILALTHFRQVTRSQSSNRS
jgi:hypothetical protein